MQSGSWAVSYSDRKTKISQLLIALLSTVFLSHIFMPRSLLPLAVVVLFFPPQETLPIAPARNRSFTFPTPHTPPHQNHFVCLFVFPLPLFLHMLLYNFLDLNVYHRFHTRLSIPGQVEFASSFSFQTTPPSIVTHIACQFFGVTLTNYQKFSGFKQQKCILSQLWKSVVQNKGVSRAMFLSREGMVPFQRKLWFFQQSCMDVENWTIKKVEHQRSDVFELVLEKTLESPLDCKEIQGNQS